MELPTKIIKASRLDPKQLLIFGLPKCGKTTIISKLDNCLIVDFEEGSDYVDAVKVKITNFQELTELMKALKSVKDKTGENPYKYIVLDTVTALEDIVLPFAKQLYMAEPMGKNWKGEDVKKLPNGAGYLYLREAFFKAINAFTKYCGTTILIGHIKDKLVEKAGEEHSEKSVDLTGKIAGLTAGKVDAIGYMYADKDDRFIDFEPSERMIAGNRSRHLSGKKIKISEKNEKEEILVNWNQIFIEK